MPRMPDCQYLSQVKSPEINYGNAEYHCSRFNWTDTTFKTETRTGVIADIVSITINKELFKQCIHCSEKRPGKDI